MPTVAILSSINVSAEVDKARKHCTRVYKHATHIGDRCRKIVLRAGRGGDLSKLGDAQRCLRVANEIAGDASPTAGAVTYPLDARCKKAEMQLRALRRVAVGLLRRR